ncbi:MAG: redoxin domain-containing protein [Alphaproteobacteria bacterium]|nr:redoxin domain-containing protein [Alphaproteobacteria bacterium]
MPNGSTPEDPTPHAPSAQREARLSALKAVFIVPYFAGHAAILAWGAWAVFGGAPALPWAGALLSSGAVTILLASLYSFRVPRTSVHLPWLLAAAGLGLPLAAAGAVTAPAAGIVPLAFALWGAVTTPTYVFWYSRFGRERAAALAVGRRLPEFPLTTLDGARVSSRTLLGQPTLFVFHRGAWCPVCIAQLKELSDSAEAFAARGCRLVSLSPQPAGFSKALARRLGGLDYYADPDLEAARILGIFQAEGVPAGFRKLGFGSDTVLPTVTLVDAAGVVLLSDEPDNYRQRPAPERFLRLLDAPT